MKSYSIQSGDSLSKIAQKFGFKGYEPIWIYNTQVKNNLTSGDPNKIDVGVKVVIPKTQSEYGEAIKRLQELIVSVQQDFGEIAGDLDNAKRETDQYGDNLDLAADVLMIAKSGTKQVLKLGSKKMKTLVVKKKILEATTKIATDKAFAGESSNEKLVVEQAAGAVVDNSIMMMAKNQFNAAKAKDEFATGMAKGLAKKGAVMVTKSVVPVEEANGAVEVVSMVADFLIGGLDAIKPTNVAKTWIWATTGEHPDTAYDKAQKHIRQQQQASLSILSETISKLEAERKLLYG